MAIFPADYTEGEEWIPLIPLNNAPFADYDTEAERLTPELFAQRWNPTRMQHAASEKHTFRKMKREQAMLRKFVEVNARSAANLIIVDVDLASGRQWVEELIIRGELPYYSFLIENPENGHCHAGWFIEGVARTRKQKDALVVLRNAFGRKVEPQPEAYAFWGMRNPLWASARVFWGTAFEYPFAELFAYVPAEVVREERERLAARRDRYGKEQPLNPDSPQRFTDLRNECRGFLYGKQGRADFAEWATDYCLARNTEFREPLPEREVRSMAKNIIRFIMNRMDAPSPQSRAAKRKKLLSTEAFSAEQRAASLSRPVVAQAVERHKQVLELAEQGYTAKDIGRHFNVKPAAARQWMTRARKWAEKQTR